MLPISIDVARLRVILVGEGHAACRRLALLDDAGAKQVEVYAALPSSDLAAAAGARLRRRLPQAEDIAGARLMFLAGIDAQSAAQLRKLACDAGILLNVEDDIACSDFHSPAVMRRGDLTVAISTGGKSPGLAAAIRREIDERFGSEWAAQLERIAALRASWRNGTTGNRGTDRAVVARRTAAWFNAQGAIGAQPTPTQSGAGPIRKALASRFRA